jgi:hypothetical protein
MAFSSVRPVQCTAINTCPRTVNLTVAFIDVEEQGVDQALARLRFEWQALYDNGIVPQKPPKNSSANTMEPIQ